MHLQWSGHRLVNGFMLVKELSQNMLIELYNVPLHIYMYM